MPSNTSNNNVKHKVNGFDIAFSKTKNKWEVRNGNKFVMEGNFKECKKYCREK